MLIVFNTAYNMCASKFVIFRRRGFDWISTEFEGFVWFETVVCMFEMNDLLDAI